MLSISIPASALREAFAVLAKLIPDRTTLPVLGHVRLERIQNRICLTATDLDRWLTFTHLAEPEPITALAKTLATLRWPREAGALLVPKTALRDALKAADKDSTITFSVTFEIDESAPVPADNETPLRRIVHLSYQMNGQPISIDVESYRPDDFPPEPDVLSAHACLLDTDTRASLIEAGQFASTDTSRYVLNGVYVETRHADRPTPSVIVSTDGRRLYRRGAPAFAPLGVNLIIPSGIIGLLSHPALLSHDWRFFTDKDTQHVHITAGPWKLIGRLIEGNFPNYRQVIPSEAAASAPLGSSPHRQFVDILSKLPPPPKGKTESITLRFQRDRLGIEDPHTKAAIIVPGITLIGPPKSIALNRHFLREMLATGPGTFHLIDEMSPLRYETTRHAVHVVMPMRTT